MTLFLDTSHKILTIGLMKDNQLEYVHKQVLNQDLSLHLMPNIKKAITEANIKPDDITKIIIANGPGSFTGLRLGVTVAKTWAFSKGVSVIPISSLKAIASTSDAEYIIPIINARRGYVFGAIYDKELNPILKDAYLSLDNLLEEISKLDKPYLIVSDDKFDNLNTIPTDINIERLIKHSSKTIVMFSTW